MPVRLYAFLRLRPRAGIALPPGLDGERITILICAGYSVAVADNRGAALDPSPGNLLEFDRVIRDLSEMSDAILPARFGIVAPSAAKLKAEFAERAGALGTALDNVSGRVQMTVRIPAVPEGPVTRITRRPRRSGSGKGSAYLQTRAAISRPPALRKLQDALAGLVRDERIEPGPGGTSVYHLIERGDVEAYLSRARELRPSGPFPPYAFAPGIDHAVWPGHDDEKSKLTEARSARPRTYRRSARNAGR